jgi:hypothetical protein
MTQDQQVQVVGSLGNMITTLLSSVKKLGNLGHGAVAITGATQMDLELERCLKVSFRPLDKEITSRLFGTYGPLGTFAARMDVSLAMGIIERDVYDELRRIKKIRNTFAHSKVLLSFDSDSIAKLVDELRPAALPNAVRTQRWLDSINFINDALETFLASKGITENISAKNLPKPPDK